MDRYACGWALLASLVLTSLGGCSLPAEQLSVPGPVKPLAGPPQIASANHRAGVPAVTGSIPEASTSRIYPGTAVYAGHPTPQPLAAEPRPGEGVTLSLSEVSIAEAARVILGEMLGLTFVVSEKVKGTITLQSSRPVSREALLEAFETVLKGEGAAIVADKGVYQVVPISEAMTSAPLRGRSGNYRRHPGVSSLVVPLQFVSAVEMERIIKSVTPQSTILRVDATRNLLVIAGTRAELDSVLDTVSIFDVDWMRGMSFALLPVDTADPDAIAQELDTIFANDKDGPAKGVVRFVPNRRLKSILVISSRPEYLRKAEAWMRRIDMVSKATEKQVHVYHIQNRTAVELASLLQRVYSGQSGRGQPLLTSSTAPPPAPTALLSAPIIGPTGITPAVIPTPLPLPGSSVLSAPTTSNGPGVDPGAPVAPEGPPSSAPPGADPARTSGVPEERMPAISVVPDEANNALVITATAKEYKRVRQILERIDVMPNQVLLEATIAEVKLNDNLKYGIRAFLRSGDNTISFNDNTTGTVASAFPGFSNFFNTPNVQVAINALSSVTDVNIVSAPTLMVLDNRRAVLQVGDEVPIATGSSINTGIAGSPIVNTIAYKSTGIVLNITPRINDKNRVLLDIEQEVSDVTPTTSSGIDSPTIQQRRVRTTVTVNDGESIVLAGLQQDKSTLSRGKVPLAGDIPVFGNLFKNKDDQIARTELFIAITPRIVKDARQVRGVTEEFRDKLNFTLRPQRAAPPDRKEQWNRVIVR